MSNAIALVAKGEDLLARTRVFSRSRLLELESENIGSENFPEDVIREAHRLGVFKAAAPLTHGGSEMKMEGLLRLVQEISYGSPSIAAAFIGNLLGYSALLLYGSPALKERVGKEWANEESLWSFGMTESRAGSDLLAISTEARRVDGGFVLSGEKNYITNATVSRRLVIFARLRDMNGNDEGITCFFVPGDAKGVERGPKMTKVGLKMANTGTLIFKDVLLSEDSLLGEPGGGLRILTHCLNRSKTLLAAMGVGIADRALDLCVERLGSTERFDKCLLDQPAIRHLLARLHTKRQAAWLLAMDAASAWDAGEDATKHSSMAKLFAGSMAVEVCSQAMELFGARGYFNDFEVSRLISDAKVIEIVEGPSLVQELLIAKAILPKRNVARKTAEVFTLKKSDLKKAG